jgi:hypothetical protein
MRSPESMSISEFMSRDFAKEFRIKRINRRKFVLKAAGLTAIVMLGAPDLSFATTSLDEGASKVYYKLVSIGKWIIIFKGAISTISEVSKGDFDAAKRQFISYLFVYLLLLGLPWGMNQVDLIFKDIS